MSMTKHQCLEYKAGLRRIRQKDREEAEKKNPGGFVLPINPATGEKK